MSTKRFFPSNTGDYKLMATSQGFKVEQYGKTSVLRPEVKATGKSPLPETDIVFNSTKADGKGHWSFRQPPPKEWVVKVPVLDTNFCFHLKTGPFKHLGIFPEQQCNWEFIAQNMQLLESRVDNPKVLNLFAYTGGASLVAKHFGADVVHVDSSKSVINWARKNMELNGLDNIRWCVEDALKFLQKEARRGRIYQGIIMDPPAMGVSNGKVAWKIEDAISPLLENAVKILDSKQHFLVLNTYSPKIKTKLLLNCLKPLKNSKIEQGSLCLKPEKGEVLETGHLLRLSNLL